MSYQKKKNPSCLTSFWCLQSSALRMFASPLRRWSYGVVLYEIFTIGNVLRNLSTLWCWFNYELLCWNIPSNFVKLISKNYLDGQTSWSFPCNSILRLMKQEVQQWSWFSRTVWFPSNYFSGGSPYPRMDGRKIANLLQQGYRMPKPQHVDDKL